jgi:hypothetical protein
VCLFCCEDRDQFRRTNELLIFRIDTTRLRRGACDDSGTLRCAGVGWERCSSTPFSNIARARRGFSIRSRFIRPSGASEVALLATVRSSADSSTSQLLVVVLMSESDGCDLVSITFGRLRHLPAEKPIDDCEVHQSQKHSEALPNEADPQRVRPRQHCR